MSKEGKELIPQNSNPGFAVKALDKVGLAVPGGMIVLGGALENNNLLIAGLITGAVVGYSRVPYESIFRKIRNTKNFITEAAKFTWEVKGEYIEIFRDCFTAPLTLAQQLRERHKNLVGSTIASPLFLAPPLLGAIAAHLTGNPLDGIGTASAIWFSVGSILAPAVYPVTETSNEPVQKADQILVMEHGRLVESGNHSQLLKNNGVYAQIVHQSELKG